MIMPSQLCLLHIFLYNTIIKVTYKNSLTLGYPNYITSNFGTSYIN